jgi:hypothetical protein
MRNSKKFEKYVPKDLVSEHKMYDTDGNFHRLQLIDRGNDYMDRFLVKEDGKVVFFSIEREACQQEYDSRKVKYEVQNV